MFFTKGEPERHSAFVMTPSASALFSPRSKTLRLRTEMPCSCTALAREKSGLRGFEMVNLLLPETAETVTSQEVYYPGA